VAAVGSAARAAVYAERQPSRPHQEADQAAATASAAEQRDQAALLLDLFGDHLGPITDQGRWLSYADGSLRWSLLPSRRDTRIDPTWLRWADGAVLGLAQAVYEEQAFERLPILADALEEAGCDDAGLLAHLRSPGVHARGCWAVDALLGKE
jgi:hypothetical protein